MNIASGLTSDKFRWRDATARESTGLEHPLTKYNLQSRSRHASEPRTNVVQSGQSAGLARIRGCFANDFHNLFHSFCEDPAIARR